MKKTYNLTVAQAALGLNEGILNPVIQAIIPMSGATVSVGEPRVSSKGGDPNTLLASSAGVVVHPRTPPPPLIFYQKYNF